MRIKRTSQIITAFIIVLSLGAITCAVFARFSWLKSQQVYESRRQMFGFADQLARGSDRLTNDVRAYSSTGDRRYYDDFQKELKVDRNRDIAFEAMQRIGLTEEEQGLITRAKKNSDALVSLENQAFAAVENHDVPRAIQIVYGPEYVSAKASIMEPIADCRKLLEKRLTQEASDLAHRAKNLDNFALSILLFNAITILSVLLLFYRRKVINPLAQIDSSLRDLIARKSGAAIGYQEESSEIGEVARSIEKYRVNVEEADRQHWVKTNLADIADALQDVDHPADFGRHLLSRLVPLVNGGFGAFHLFHESDGRFHFTSGYGFEQSSGSFAPREGIAGQAAFEKRLIEIKDLPPDYVKIASGLGKATPRVLAAIPLIAQDRVLGVVEVASFSAFTKEQRTLLEEGTGVVALKLDILQRNLRTRELLEQVRLSEQQVKHSNFLADGALDLTKSGYWHVPLDGSGWYNSSERAARIFGDPPTPDHRYTLEHWSRHVFLGDETAAKMTMENFNAAVAGTIPEYDATYAYKRPIDGQVVWIHALGHVKKDASGKPTDMFGVTQDITDFKLLEIELLGAKQKAEEATVMKSMFLANMSHEIRTPMNAIIGLSYLALKTSLNSKQRDYLNKIHNAGTSLLAVINDILDFSKIEAGKLDIEEIDFRLDDVITSVTNITGQKAHEKGLEFLADVPGSVPQFLLGDPLRLGQVLTNLVNNAVKFTENGEIRLKAEVVEQRGDKCQLRFSVRDSGIGMTKEQASRLFQPFTQADMSTTRKHGGTGLGLTICRRLVELMGGQIWLDSEPGKGSTFSFTVWLGRGAEKGSGKIIPERLTTVNALVVDDNPAACEIIQDSLRSIVHRVDTTQSADAAIAAIKKNDADQPYDIVFMDWRMPGMDGLQAARLIKSDETLRHPPAIVLVTAFGREEVREEAEHLHLDGFLIKPVTKSVLVDALVNVFATPAEDVAGVEAGKEDRRLQGLRVLLAEDNEINQQIAVELLDGVGAKVDVANNGREAVEKLFQASYPPPYDLILMDLQMPEMDGYQATTKIRSDSRFERWPIIAMTAHATVEERQRCIDAGMNDHVAKPIDPALLFETLTRFYKPADHAAVEVKQESPAATKEPEEIPSVEGLDTKDGLTRVAGNRKLYRKLLRQFLAQQKTAPEQISQALAGKDSKLAERLAHTVKGVAGSLGARAVQQASAALEKAISSQSPSKVLEPALHEFRSVLNSFLSRLQAALPGEVAPAQPPPVASIDPEQAKKLVNEMILHLNNFDPAAGELLELHRETFRTFFRPEAFAAFEKQIESFSYGDALTAMDRVAREMGVLQA